MSVTASFDIGSTFTDGFFTDGNRIARAKVDTTPHDLTSCFFSCLEEGAKKLEYPTLSDFLKKASSVRYSTTIATNLLIQKTGPKLGLLVTKGYEDSLYGREKSPAIDFLVQRDMIIGTEADDIQRGINRGLAINSIRHLLQNGAKKLVVSFKSSLSDPANEVNVKSLVEEQYPAHYLGSVPVFLGHQICHRSDDQTRTHMALLDAYVHDALVKHLYKVEDRLREMGYSKPLSVVHSNGGILRVAKTSAVDTIGSGPVGGLFGARYLAKLYDLQSVLTIDIGGTSTDVGVITAGNPIYRPVSELAGIPVKLPLIAVSSIGGGGGSIVRARTHRTITVGPESMGAYPGPACFDLGGNEATLTDAEVVLGYLNPSYFLGGKKKLNPDKSREVIRQRVADAMGLTVEEAAALAIEEFYRSCALGIKKVLAMEGAAGNDLVLFAYGGGGPLHCSGMAERVSIVQVYVFSFSAVLSAFGVAVMDTMHNCHKTLGVKALAHIDEDAARKIRTSILELTRTATRDMASEGISLDRIAFQLDFEVMDQSNQTSLVSIALSGAGEDHVGQVMDELNRRVTPTGELFIESVTLKAIFHREPPKLASSGLAEAGKAGNTARKWRQVYLDGDFHETPIYELDSLRPGSVITGPAIAEGIDTTCLIRPGWSFRINEHMNGILSRSSR